VEGTEVQGMFKDAERLYEEALRDLKVDRRRMAAENAWCATLKATDAFILARTVRSLLEAMLQLRGFTSYALKIRV